jgi:hypothetical protein
VVSTGTLVASYLAVSASTIRSAITAARKSASAVARFVARAFPKTLARGREGTSCGPRLLLRFPQRSLFLEKPECCGSYLDSIVALEQRFQRKYFSRSETRIQHVLKLAPDCGFATASSIAG